MSDFERNGCLGWMIVVCAVTILLVGMVIGHTAWR